ncbi:hypothetical protein D3C77_571910 [compost metagenome]
MQAESVHQATQAPNSVPEFPKRRVLALENPVENDEGFDAGAGKNSDRGMIDKGDRPPILHLNSRSVQ